MEIIADFLFELIIEGSLDAFSVKRVPLPLRIIAAIILTGVYGGLTGIFIYCGIRHKNPIMLLLGAALLIFIILGVRAIYKKHRK